MKNSKERFGCEFQEDRKKGKSSGIRFLRYLEQDLDALERGNGGLGDPSGDSAGDELLDDKGHRALDETLDRPSTPLFPSPLLVRHR